MQICNIYPMSVTYYKSIVSAISLVIVHWLPVLYFHTKIKHSAIILLVKTKLYCHYSVIYILDASYSFMKSGFWVRPQVTCSYHVVMRISKGFFVICVKLDSFWPSSCFTQPTTHRFKQCNFRLGVQEIVRNT